MPDRIRLEAEAFVLSGDYTIESRPIASSGSLIRALNSSGTASTTFSGEAGKYRFDVIYFDESDGVATFEVLVNGAVVQTWQGTGGFNGFGTPFTRTFSANLADGDTLTLRGVKGGEELARFDAVDLTLETPAVSPPPNVSPVASDDAVQTTQTVPIIVDVLSNDADANGDALFVSAIGSTPIAVDETAAIGGADITLNSNGTLTVTPGMGVTGTLSFDYTVSDGQGSDTATVTVSVATSPPTAPPPTPLRPGEFGIGAIEIENLNLTGDYVVNTRSEASGGALVRTFSTGDATGSFVGLSGTYAFATQFFNESDGIALFQILVNGEVVDAWQGIGGQGGLGTPEVHVSELALETGDTITYRGIRGGEELARLDKVDISLVSLAATDPVATGDAASTLEDTTTAIDVIANDIGEGVLTVTAINGHALGEVGVPVDLPSGGQVSRNADGLLVYAPATDANGTDSFTYTVSNGSGSDEATVQLTIAPANDAPILSLSTPVVAAVAGQSVTMMLSASDIDGDTLVFSAAYEGGALPSWLSLDANTGAFTGAPDGADAGQYTITVRATDPDQAFDEGLIVFNILPADMPPVAEDGFLPTILPGSSGGSVTPDRTFFDPGLATDAETTLDPSNFVFTGGRIDGGATLTLGALGFSYNSHSGEFTLAPAARAEYVALGDSQSLTVELDFTVTDGTSTDSATLHVTIAGENDGPSVIDPLEDRAVTAGETAIIQVPADTFGDADAGDTLTLSASLDDGSPLPDWVGFTAANGTFTLTPTESEIGAIDIRITATDAAGASTDDTLTLSVEPQPVVALTAPITETAFETFGVLEGEARTGITTLDIGPDGNLYSGDIFGNILRYIIDPATGLAERTELVAQVSGVVTGLKMDPGATADEPSFWVSYSGLSNEFDGTVSNITLPVDGPAVETPAIVGLPFGGHQVNGLDFGPDGMLYIVVGGVSSLGAFSAGAFAASETALSAAVIVADVANDPAFANGPVDVTAPLDGSGYDPTAPGAPVTLFATGLRNSYDIEWTLNDAGEYVAVSGINGNSLNKARTPDDPDTLLDETLVGVKPPEQFAVIQNGVYYGHPNPARGEYILNGGNPTSSVDPWEITEYPLGTLSEAAFDPSLILDIDQFGADSPNGIDTYIDGTILQTTFSGDRKVLLMGVDANNQPVYLGDLDDASGNAITFASPLDIVTDPKTGRIYVANFGNSQSDASDGAIFLIVPEAGAITPEPGRPSGTGGSGSSGNPNGRIEAETFQVIDGLATETIADASDGEGLGVATGSTTGTSLLRFSGEADTYTLTIALFDESDGQGQITVFQDSEQIGVISLDLDAGGDAPDTSALRLVTIHDLGLQAGASLRFIHQADGGETASIDYVTLEPAPSPPPPPPPPSGDPETLWSETFNTLASGTREDTGETAWTSTSINSMPGAIFGVEAGAFRFSVTTNNPDNDGAFTRWETAAIDVSGMTGLTLEYELFSSSGLEASGAYRDFIQTYVVVDGVRTDLSLVNGGRGDTLQAIELADLPEGNSLVIGFEAKSTFRTERYEIDNLVLTGIRSGAEGQAPSLAYNLMPGAMSRASFANGLDETPDPAAGPASMDLLTIMDNESLFAGVDDDHFIA